MKIIIINGPNLNLIGQREKEIYGNTSFQDYFEALRSKFLSIRLDHYQTNIEGEIINKIQDAAGKYDGIILNAGGYTHTSVSIADAVRAIAIPVVEAHISNIFSREEYRHVSLIAPYSKGTIIGFGLLSYELAIECFLKQGR